MGNHLCRAIFIGLTATIFVPALGFAQTPNPVFEKIEQADKELWELQLKIDELHRHVPSCMPEEEEQWIGEWATQGAELSTFDIKLDGREQLRFADGQPADFELIRFEISGRDPYEKVHDFLIRLARRYRLIDLERLHLKADAVDTVSFTGRLALPCYKQAEEEESNWTGIEDAIAKIVEHRRETYQKLTELTERSNTGRFSMALATFERESRTRPVALTEARLIGEEIVLEGLLYGAAAQAGLEPALGKVGFRDIQVKLLPADACQRFSIAAHLERREQELEIVIGNGPFGPFDDQAAAFCKTPPPAGRVAFQGKALSPDALTLHLRDVDLIDVFSVLHDLTSQNFLTDSEVRGRVSVDVEGATLEETLGAMSSFVTVGSGPLRRVSRAGSQPVAMTRSSYVGEPFDVSIDDTPLTQFLCVLEQVSERQVLAPPDLKGTVRLFANDLPWDQVLDGLLSTAGLTFVLEDKRLLVGPGPEAALKGRSDLVNACEIPIFHEPSSRLASAYASLEELGASDLSLAGLARKGDTWKAYAHSPSRRFLRLKEGSKLLDGSITSIGPEGVRITTGGSEVVTVRLPL